MTVARITEISATSTKSFEDAIRDGIERACKTLDNVTGAWVSDFKVDVEKDKVTQFRVVMKVSFVLKG